MPKVMSHEMALRHNWCGNNRAKKGEAGGDENGAVPGKVGFSNSPLVDIIKSKSINVKLFVHKIIFLVIFAIKYSNEMCSLSLLHLWVKI